MIYIYLKNNCPKCIEFKNFWNIVSTDLELIPDIDYIIRDLDKNYIDGLSQQVAVAPSMVINDELVFNGIVPTIKELYDSIKK